MSSRGTSSLVAMATKVSDCTFGWSDLDWIRKPL